MRQSLESKQTLSILNKTDTLADHAATHLVKLFNQVLNVQERLYFIPSSGRTPTQTYALLRTKYSNTVDWSRVTIIQMDEYVGHLDYALSFHHYLKSQLIEPLGITEFIGLFDPDKSHSKSLTEVKRSFINIPRIDVALHGIGRNGHIGFNEPGDKNLDWLKRVELTKVTQNDNFPNMIPQHAPKYGITLGLSFLGKVKHNFLLATGEAKADAISKLMRRAPVAQTPACQLWNSSNFYIYADMAAASQLNTSVLAA